MSVSLPDAARDPCTLIDPQRISGAGSWIGYKQSRTTNEIYVLNPRGKTIAAGFLFKG